MTWRASGVRLHVYHGEEEEEEEEEETNACGCTMSTHSITGHQEELDLPKRQRVQQRRDVRLAPQLLPDGQRGNGVHGPHVQGLALVHFSAQPEPVLTQNSPLNTP